MSISKLQLAACIMEGVARGGASRHVAAATAAALWRVATSAPGADEEICARIGLIEPVIREKVRAATRGDEASLSGGKRAMRNVAVHAGFGEGAAALPATGAEAKARQRGSRAARAIALPKGPLQRTEG